MKLSNYISWKSFGPALFVAVAMVFGLQSCENKEDNGTTDGQEARLIVNDGDAQVVFSDAPGTMVVNLNCNATWVVESSATWCKVTPTSGRASVPAVSRIEVVESKELDPRTAILKYTAGALNSTLYVTQQGKTPALDIVAKSPTTRNEEKETAITSAAATLTYTITANQPWAAVVADPAATWLTITSAASSTAASTNFTAAALANADFAERRADIIVTGTHSEDTIKVIQAAAIPVIAVSPVSANPASAAGSVSVNLTANVDWTVTKDAAATWLSFTPATGTGNSTLTMTYPANTATTSRSATVTVQANDYPAVSGTYVLTQAAFAPSVVVAPVSSTPSDAAGSVSVNVTANVSWTASKDAAATWVSFSPSSATANGTMTINYTANTAATSRSATITVQAKDYASTKATYVLTQSGGTPPPITVTAVNDSSARIQITGTGLNLVTSVTSGASSWTIIPSKQTATSLWAVAPATSTVAAGSTVSVTLNYAGGSVVAKPNFMVTDFYTIQFTATGNSYTASTPQSVISFTKEPYALTVCEAENQKLSSDFLVNAKTSTTFSFVPTGASTGTTNKFKCSTTGNGVNTWSMTDKNALHLKTAAGNVPSPTTIGLVYMGDPDLETTFSQTDAAKLNNEMLFAAGSGTANEFIGYIRMVSPSEGSSSGGSRGPKTRRIIYTIVNSDASPSEGRVTVKARVLRLPNDYGDAAHENIDYLP